ncbi:MAG: right-handed parallel beta-helix repeat-containing protein [Phycisphaerae bacterium]
MTAKTIIISLFLTGTILAGRFDITAPASPSDASSAVTQLKKAFNSAVNSTEHMQINMGAGVYDFSGMQVEGEYVFELESRRNFTLDGAGAKVILPRGKGFIRLSQCIRAEVSGLELHQAVLPFTQGVVEEVDADSFSITATIARDYPDAPASGGVCALLKNDLYTHNWFDAESVERLGEGKFRITCPKSQQTKLRVIEKGRGFVLSGPGELSADIIAAENCERLLLRNLSISSAAGDAITILGCRGAELARVTVAPKSGTRNLASATGQALRITDTDNLTLTNCHFEGCLDSSLSISSSARKARRLAPDMFELLATNRKEGIIAANDLIQLFDPQRAKVVDEVFVSEVIRPNDSKLILKLKRPANDAGNYDRDALEILFKPLAQAIVTNCSFANQVKTGLILRCSAEVRHCSFWHLAAGLQSYNSIKSAEGPIPADIVIRNNKFSEILFAPITITRLAAGSLAPAGELAGGPAGGPVIVDSNEIKMLYKNAISISNTAKAEVLRNVIYKPQRYSQNCEPVITSDCGDVTLVPTRKGYYDMDLLPQ